MHASGQGQADDHHHGDAQPELDVLGPAFVGRHRLGALEQDVNNGNDRQQQYQSGQRLSLRV